MQREDAVLFSAFCSILPVELKHRCVFFSLCVKDVSLIRAHTAYVAVVRVLWLCRLGIGAAERSNCALPPVGGAQRSQVAGGVA